MKKPAYLILLIAITCGSPSIAWNSPPVIDTLSDDTLNEGESINRLVTASDNDPEDLIEMFLIPPPEDSIFMDYLSFGRVCDGWSFEFSPNFDFIPPGLDTSFLMTFYATDNKDTVSRSITITVRDSNPPPVLDSIGNHRVADGTILEIIVSAEDPDGSIPQLSTSEPLPANAAFVDNGDGSGLFTFSPESQYGDSAQDYPITFYANDTLSTDSELVNIRVVGPYQPPTLNPIGISDTTLIEGEYLQLTIIGTDPHDARLEFSVTGDPMPRNTTLVQEGMNSADFLFPAYVADTTTYSLTFHAYNGLDSDSETILVTVQDSADFPPIFTSPEITTVAVNEGEESIFTIAAFEPEGGGIRFDTTGSTVDSVYFEDYGDGTALFGFYPDLTEGGRTYDVTFFALELDTAGSITGIYDSLILSITVHEVDTPPNITLDKSGTVTMDEGEFLKINMKAEDNICRQDIWIFPPPDSSVYNNNLQFIRVSYDSAVVKFAPDHFFVPEGGSLKSRKIKFYAADGIDTLFEEVEILVGNVVKQYGDSGVADTLVWEGAVWNDTASGFSVDCRITNDDSIAGATTGFRWHEPWLKCDSISTPLLDDIGFGHQWIKEIEIYEDSLMFLVGFLFFDTLFIPPGNNDYFTAHFSYNPDSVDWKSYSDIRFEPTKIGSDRDFVFDGRIRYKSFKEEADDYLDLSAGASTYKPIVVMREIRYATDSVALKVFSVRDISPLSEIDTIFSTNLNDDTLWYDLQISLENELLLTGMNLGFIIRSEDGATWIYDDTLPPRLLPGNRMNPDNSVWDPLGLQIDKINFDGALNDTILFSGVANSEPNGGLPAGLVEHMISVRFRPVDIDSGVTNTICIDVVDLENHDYWSFIRPPDTIFGPTFGGTVCFPVTNRSIVVDVDETRSVPGSYSLSQNYPNPFNPSTTIRFTLPRREKITLVVYNILGQVVNILADRIYPPGQHQITWDGKNGHGRQVASGIYLYHMVTEGFRETKKMVLLR